MKKKIILICLIFMLAVFALSACAAQTQDLFGDYNRYPAEEEKAAVTDDGVVIDGKFDDAIWQGKTWKEYVSKEENLDDRFQMVRLEDCNLRFTGAFTDGGVYFAAETDDPVNWNGNEEDVRNDIFKKTGMTIYVAPYSFTSISQGAFEMGFASDGTYQVRRHAFGTWRPYPLEGMENVTLVKGEINTADTEGYSIEVFVPWSGLGLTVKPDKIRTNLTIERNEKAAPESPYAWEMPGAPEGVVFSDPRTWSVFDENGLYVPPEGETFGNFGDKNYSEGFDLSLDTGENPSVHSTAGPDARLYIKESLGTQFYAETFIKVNEIYNHDPAPKVGFFFSGEKINDDSSVTVKSLVAMLKITPDGNVIDGFVATENKDNKYSEWNWGSLNAVNTGNVFDGTTDGVKITVYRNGEKFYYFANDKFLAEKTYAGLTADMVMHGAIYSFNTGADYYGYSILRGEEAVTAGEELLGDVIPKSYVIDGDGADWTDYTGKTIGSYAYDDSGKQFTVKSVLKPDGLYFLTEAKHALYLTGDPEWSHNTSLEVGITINNGKDSTRIYVTPDVVSGATAVMKTADNGFIGSDTRYTTVTEGFIPLSRLNDLKAVENGNVRIAFAWRTGTGKKTQDGQWDLNENDIINSLGRISDQPYIWNYIDAPAWDLRTRNYVDSTGLKTVSGKAAEKVIDGDGNDWADYDGKVIRALGAGEDAGLGFESKLYKGADGVYFYTEANHRKYSTNDNDIGFLTNFVLETGVSDLTVGGEVSGKKQFFFTPIGTRHGGAVDYEMITDFNDETGVYNTVVEGFIPSNELLNVTGVWLDRVDTETATANEGYSVRIGAAWRTRDDKIQCFNRGDVPFVQPADADGAAVANMYYLSEEGLFTSAYRSEAFTVDGFGSDWSGVEEMSSVTGADPTLGDLPQRGASYKAVYREEGLYILCTAKTYKFTESNYVSGKANNAIAFRNTSLEVRIAKPAGGNAQIWITSYGNVLPRKIESAFSVTPQTVGTDAESRTLYNVTIEAFVSADALKQLLGVTSLDDALSIAAVFTNVSAQGDSGLSSDPINGGAVTVTTSGFYGTFDKITVEKQ